MRSNYTADISRMREVYTADVDHLRTQLATAEEAKTEAEVRLRRTEANLTELQKDEPKKLEIAYEVCLCPLCYRDLACIPSVRRGEQDRSSGGDQDKVNQLNDKLLETDRELQVFRQRCIALTEERTRERTVNTKLKESLKEANAEVDRLSLAHHASMNEVKSLREELCHHKKVHEAEMQEFSTLMQRESTQETVSIFRTEIMQVLREIQIEYEQRLEAAKTDIQAAFDVKTQMLKKVHASDGKERDQYREENSKLRALLQRLRLDFEALLDSKLGLEMEIASYRRLLECEEKRFLWRC
ncbi:unnamed protein product [Dibothriocephalus latus]|uniref:IF rod domain-containing protein n=1 Tax=Dibothriocephalus latus TaxID=60516 RepID=A0A3P6T7E3_DIBLA|nr:unnamed protein product [Dibothriocephalus latus]